MAISVPCDCGALLVVSGDSARTEVTCFRCRRVAPLAPAALDASFDFQDGTKSCPVCGESNPVTQVRCVNCDGCIPTVDIAARRRTAEAPAIPGPKSAWEVRVALGLVALLAIGNLVEMNLIGAVLGVVMFAGLLARTDWGWWLTTVLSGIGVFLCLALAAIADRLPEVGEPALVAAVLCVTAAAHAAVIALLGMSRFRGAYSNGEEA